MPLRPAAPAWDRQRPDIQLLFWLTSLALLLLGISGAFAQPAPTGPGPEYYPNWYKGYIPSPYEWQVMWSNKLGYYTGGLPITLGGTGATTAAQAAINLGLPSGGLLSGQIFVGNASNHTTPVTPSGDLTMNNAGAFSVVNGSHITNASIPNSGLVNTGVTVNGTTCTLGSSCTPSSVASSIGINSTGDPILRTRGCWARLVRVP